MVKLARNEHCIALYPLAAHYSIGPFPARVIFRPSQGPFILGLISRFGYLRPITGLFYLWVVGGNRPPRSPMGTEPLFGSAGSGGCTKSRSRRHTHTKIYP